MKILFLTSHLNTGGITSYLFSLTCGLIRDGHQVFIASADGDCRKKFESAGAEFFDLGFRTKSEIHPKIFLSLGSLKRLIVENNIDVIHAQTRVTQVAGFFLSRMTQKPLITTCHGFFKVRIFRRIFPCWGSAVIAISKPVQEHLTKDFRVNPNNVFLIENGVDYQRFDQITQDVRILKREKWGIKTKYVIGIIARLSWVKGIDVLLNSMKIVVEQITDIQLLIIGEGPEYEKLKDLVDELNLSYFVRFEKVVNQTADVLPIFDLFIMPSRQEGLGLAVMEAQACALPVIACRVGGLVDLVQDGKTGYLVEPQNVQHLADKIIEVLNKLQEAKLVGIAARKQIIEKFSLERMLSLTLNVYEQYSRH